MHSERKRWNVIALLLLLGSLSPGDVWARAETSRDRAVECWNLGLQLFNAGKVAEAMKAFARGYELSHKAGFLFNMAECARMMNDKAQARRLYLRYLTEHPRGKLRTEARRRCQELGLGFCAPAGAEASPPEPAGPAVDDEDIPPVATPLPTSTSQPPAAKPYLPATQESARQAPAKPFYKRWPLWVGVGLVVVGGTVTAAVLASRSRERTVPDGDYVVDFGH